METFEVSLVDYLVDSDNNEIIPQGLEYDKDYEVKGEDPHWNYSLIPMLDLEDLNAKLNEEWYDWIQLFWKEKWSFYSPYQ